MEKSFTQVSDKLGSQYYLIEKSGMSEWQKENSRRVLSGLTELSEQELKLQQEYYCPPAANAVTIV